MNGFAVTQQIFARKCLKLSLLNKRRKVTRYNSPHTIQKIFQDFRENCIMLIVSKKTKSHRKGFTAHGRSVVRAYVRQPASFSCRPWGWRRRNHVSNDPDYWCDKSTSQLVSVFYKKIFSVCCPWENEVAHKWGAKNSPSGQSKLKYSFLCSEAADWLTAFFRGCV